MYSTSSSGSPTASVPPSDGPLLPWCSGRLTLASPAGNIRALDWQVNAPLEVKVESASQTQQEDRKYRVAAPPPSRLASCAARQSLLRNAGGF